ncbi:uncharacterized protein TNCT_709711 [Trichonephila clavata]|uniref:Uncharacterized protein n=1 Tax=Trichonephila clavata TaxID=2740835 RepID=A0A8X6FI69_TRICU|nr:uncharacterized protein TNCT_709711 [Trichonephila clavata]
MHKKYPRCFRKETQTGEDGYPQNRRRSPENGGIVIQIKENNVVNRWVVPYNPVLSRTFNTHINVEFCNSIKSIKYICKYVNKGTGKRHSVLKISMRLQDTSRVDTLVALKQSGGFYAFLFMRGFLLLCTFLYI